MNTTHKPFTPSSTLLLSMIASAEAKFAGDREQTLLRKEAREEARSLRAWNAEVEAKRRKAMWG